MPDEKDPWASLAESLGATPSREPSPPPTQRPPEKPRVESRQEPRPEPPRAPAPRTTQGWEDLDSSLGLPPAREPARPTERRQAEARPPVEQRSPAEPSVSREPRPVERPAAPPNREFGFDEEPRRSPRSERVERTERADRGDREARVEAGEGDHQREGGEPRGAGSEPVGERRPRRRRGQRGGRGRGRGRRDRDATGVSARLGDDPSPHDADLGPEPLDELVGERPAADAEPAERPLDEEGRPRRRRRRRGRRGGRRRGAGEPGGEAEARREPGDAHDDEPLPAGYGRPQQVRQPEGREAAGRGGQGERRGRRRRRGGGDEAGRRQSTEAGGESSSRRGRRGRRVSDRDGTSSSSSLARRSRDDFAPVSRGYNEDDEGLEFLGVEDAAHEQPRREQRHTEDDVIAESGLDAVRDVPSWVEAIGIVIAGNLDARSRPRADRGEDDRRRR